MRPARHTTPHQSPTTPPLRQTHDRAHPSPPSPATHPLAQAQFRHSRRPTRRKQWEGGALFMSVSLFSLLFFSLLLCRWRCAAALGWTTLRETPTRRRFLCFLDDGDSSLRPPSPSGGFLAMNSCLVWSVDSRLAQGCDGGVIAHGGSQHEPLGSSWRQGSETSDGPNTRPRC